MFRNCSTQQPTLPLSPRFFLGVSELLKRRITAAPCFLRHAVHQTRVCLEPSNEFQKPNV
jgi:hypothetical protein